MMGSKEWANDPKQIPQEQISTKQLANSAQEHKTNRLTEGTFQALGQMDGPQFNNSRKSSSFILTEYSAWAANRLLMGRSR